MKLGSLHSVYEAVRKWSKHPKAPIYLGVVSFIDASVFPVSPLFMILPMSFSEPNKAFNFAFIAIISSFFGGIIGYELGQYCYELLIGPFIEFMSYEQYYEMALKWFDAWGFWAIVLGCLTPFIPYKIFTIGAGVMGLNFGWFLIASFAGRALRSLLIATIIRWSGPRVESVLTRWLVPGPNN